MEKMIYFGLSLSFILGAPTSFALEYFPHYSVSTHLGSISESASGGHGDGGEKVLHIPQSKQGSYEYLIFAQTHGSDEGWLYHFRTGYGAREVDEVSPKRISYTNNRCNRNESEKCFSQPMWFKLDSSKTLTQILAGYYVQPSGNITYHFWGVAGTKTYRADLGRFKTREGTEGIEEISLTRGRDQEQLIEISLQFNSKKVAINEVQFFDALGNQIGSTSGPFLGSKDAIALQTPLQVSKMRILHSVPTKKSMRALVKVSGRFIDDDQTPYVN